MLFEILSLLLEVVAGIVGAACLLRLYMQYHRIPMSLSSGNPLARFIFALTDWIVLPLRRVIPAMGRWDLASLLAAWLVQMALVALKFTLWWLLEGMAVSYGSVPVLAVFGVLSLAISGMSGLVIIYAILSWVQARHPLADLLERLVVPALAPIRRFMPLIGGIDLSPLVLLVVLQILSIVLGGLQRSVFF
jgi:YggT family protein